MGTAKRNSGTAGTQKAANFNRNKVCSAASAK
jgi:hypothetical protein